MDYKNSLVLTTVTTLVAAAANALTRYLIGSPLDFVDVAVFAAVFWVAFFLVQKWLGAKK